MKSRLFGIALSRTNPGEISVPELMANIVRWIMGICLTIMWGTLSLAASFVDSKGTLQYKCMHFWARMCLKVVESTISIKGKEKIPEGPVIYAVNHQSMIDILVVIAAIPTEFRWIAKREVFSIPFLGWHMQRSGHIKIERGNTAKSIEIMQIAAREIRKGASVVIFPEGTRSEDGQLLPFKKGGFHMALDAGVPIVPVAIKGTQLIVPKKRLRIRAGIPIQVTFGEPVYPHRFTKENMASFIKTVRESIREMLNQE